MFSFSYSKGLVKLKKTKPRSKPRKRVKKQVLSRSRLKDWSLNIRGRDSKCMSCGSEKNLHAHHIISKFYRPHLAYSLTNGITLCKQCHVGYGGVHDKRNPPKNKKIEMTLKKENIMPIKGLNSN